MIERVYNYSMVTFIRSIGNSEEGFIERLRNGNINYHYKNAIVSVHLHPLYRRFNYVSEATARLIGAVAIGEALTRKEKLYV